MPRPKGYPKTGGRRKGSRNRRTVEVAERLAELDCDPFEGMVRIAMDESAPIEVRARMHAELAQYVAPKRKAVEVTGEPQQSQPRVVVVVGRNSPGMADAETAPHEWDREPGQVLESQPPKKSGRAVAPDPATMVPTARVRTADGRLRIINRSEFDPARHELADETTPPASTPIRRSSNETDSART